MTATEILGIISGLLGIVVYGVYLRQVLRNESIPNPATWIIWVTVLIMNAFSYSIMVANWGKALLSICVAIMGSLLFLTSLIKGKFAKLEKLEYICLSLAVIVGIFWQITGDARLANIFLQAIFIIAFIPIWIGLLNGKLKEKYPPWVLAVICYSFNLAAIIIDWAGDWAQLVYPIVNGIIGNGSVAIMSIYLNKRRKPA